MPALRSLLLGIPVVLALWGTAVEAMTFLQPAGRPVAVMARGGLADALGAVIAAGGSIVQVRGNAVVAVSDEPGFVPRLYRSGALLVVTARTGGCIIAPPGASRSGAGV